MKIDLIEAGTQAPTKKGSRWRVIVAVPGKGSSGDYSVEMLKRDAEKITPPGAQSFINHEADRKPTDMIGTYPDGSYWDEDEGEEGAVVSELEVFSHWQDFVAEVGPHCGMSLYAKGEMDKDGNITAILEDVYNGCDLVARPGLKGSKIANELYESAVKASSEDPNPAAGKDNEEGEDMELKDVVDAVAALSAQVSALTDAKATEDAKTAQVEADQSAVTAAVEAYDSARKAVDAADLFDVQKDAILESAKAGVDVAPLIESAKAVKQAAVEAAKPVEQTGTHGRVFSAAESKSALDLGKVFG